MKAIEAKKFIAWLMGVFPNYNPDAGVTAIWAQGLPDVPAAAAIDAVERIRAEKPSDFAPNMIEVKTRLLNLRPRKEIARAWFYFYWEDKRESGVYADILNLLGGEVEESAARAAWDCINGCSQYNSLPTKYKHNYEREFIEIYESIVAAQENKEFQKKLSGGEFKLLSGGVD